MLYILKLLVNFIIITLEVVLVWASINAFSGKFNPIFGTIIIVCILVGLYILITQVQNRFFRYKRPGLFKTTLFVILVAIIATFAGVHPLADFKNNLFNKISGYLIEAEQNNIPSVPNAEDTTTIQPNIDTTTLNSETTAPSSDTSSSEADITTIISKPQLVNPSWEELTVFLKGDKTDSLLYDYPNFVCEDFARTLQQNANKAGWRCAYLSVQLEGYPDFYNYGIPSNTGHALNAFETTDKGIVYIDDTGLSEGGYGNCDKIVNVQVGNKYTPHRIFPSTHRMRWESMGIVVSIGNLQW